MAGFYSLSRSNVALSTTADSVTIICAASRRLRLVEVSIGGMGTASAANELSVARSTGGTTGSAALTAAPLLTDQAAAALSNFTAWVAQPTLGNVLLRLPVNANGGVYRWVARPGSEIELRNSEQLSLRSAVGTSNVSFFALVEEL